MAKILALVALGIILFLFIRALDSEGGQASILSGNSSQIQSALLETSSVNNSAKALFED